MTGVGAFCGIATNEDYGTPEERAELMEVVGKAMQNFTKLVDDVEHPDGPDGVVVEFHTQPLEDQCTFLMKLETGFAEGVSENPKSGLDKDGAVALFEAMFGHVAEEDIVGEGNSCDSFIPETDGTSDPNVSMPDPNLTGDPNMPDPNGTGADVLPAFVKKKY